MVSGRLGNDVYDFAVMADNKLPDVALHAPWQSAASMFPETWSYRSWQERGEVDVKVAEKLRSLIDVVSRGGNYLLNIGPDASGAVVPFESEVLLKIGKWLEENGEAIYNTDPSPFVTEFSWGDVTVKDRNMYLLLTGAYPEDGLIKLPLPTGEKLVKVTEQMYADSVDIQVIKLELDSNFQRQVASIADGENLSWKNATPDYSYSCFDYYSNYRSTVGYNWSVVCDQDVRGLTLGYSDSDSGKCVRVQVGNCDMVVTLSSGEAVALDSNVEIVTRSFGRMRGGTFDRNLSVEGVQWTEVDSPVMQHDVRPFSNYLLKTVLRTSNPCRVSLDVITGNGMELLVYEEASGGYVSLMKHLNPYRSQACAESVIVDLKEGDNEIILRSYNRFERKLSIWLDLHDQQCEYHTTVMFERPVSHDVEIPIRISSADNQSEHTDCKLHNLSIDLIH